jgi:hypothetical protein
MRTVWKSAAFIAIFLGFFVGSAHAQDTIIANIPFPFEVNHSKAPAGRYELVIDNGVLSLRGEDVDERVIALTSPAGGYDPQGDVPTLVFRRGEDGYRLTTIWESNSEGRALPMSSGGSKGRRGKVAFDGSENPAADMIVVAVAH